jgi:hypothetical protein|tara:strand:+ start:586 stop:1125 length:540 start_codon:yes stop_codon:yes gene_type:complete
MKIKMESIKPMELVKELDAFIMESYLDSRGCSTDDRYNFLEEEIWKVDEGSYTPIGYLKLPVLSRIDQYSYPNTELGLLTLFNDNFLGNSSYSLSQISGDRSFFDVSLQHLEDCITEDISKEGIIIIQSGDINIPSSSSKPGNVVRNHISKFFELYKEAKNVSKNTESIRCIKRCFTEY